MASSGSQTEISESSGNPDRIRDALVAALYDPDISPLCALENKAGIPVAAHCLSTAERN